MKYIIYNIYLPPPQMLPLHHLSMTESIVMAVQSLLMPKDASGSPVSQTLPVCGLDANALPNQIIRVVGEIRTR